MKQIQDLKNTRQSKDIIFEAHGLLIDSQIVTSLINALPNIVGVTNKQRQLVYVNDEFINQLGFESINEILGSRPGEAIRCIHANDGQDGCGTGEACNYCGCVEAVKISLIQNKKTTRECRLTAVLGGQETNLDLRVTATPTELLGETFVILSLEDISDHKRKKALERIFYHDILNKANSLRNSIEMINLVREKHKIEKYQLLADRISSEVIDEINAQKQLIAAENDELMVDLEQVDLPSTISGVINQLSYLAKSMGVFIHFEWNDNRHWKVCSEPVLLKRVLANVIKNAIEASGEGMKITLDIQENDQYVKVSCHNETVIPPDVKIQLFQRSFSTKGVGRGLGTYSMKLLTEKYLQGKVSFVSENGAGTTFSFDLPSSM